MMYTHARVRIQMYHKMCHKYSTCPICQTNTYLCFPLYTHASTCLLVGVFLYMCVGNVFFKRFFKNHQQPGRLSKHIHADKHNNHAKSVTTMPTNRQPCHLKLVCSITPFILIIGCEFLINLHILIFNFS